MDPRYPQQPPPGYWQPPQQPQQSPQPAQQGYPGQAPQYSPQGYQQQPAPQYGLPQAPMPQAPAPMEGQFFIPDEAKVVAEYEESRARSGRGGGPGKNNFVQFLGPDGTTKLQQGQSSKVLVYILPAPPPQPGKSPTGISVPQNSHFYKSHAKPQGSNILCPGKDKCLVCAARLAGFESFDPNVQKRAKDFGKVRTQHLYQVALLQFPHLHIGEDGRMRPKILQASSTLHNAIGKLIQERGLMKIVHPLQGRPIRLEKQKTGPETRDVEYYAIDQDPSPLPPQFNAIFQNFWDMAEFLKMPTDQEMIAAVQEMGLPMPGAPSAAYNAAPQAPYQNPYVQWGVPAQQAPAQFAGFQQSPQQQPPSAMYSAPREYLAAVGMSQADVPPSVAFSPPPVFSGPPAAVARTPVAQVAQSLDAPRALSLPIQGMLPGARERCFGARNETDNYCTECPQWIADQCKQVTPKKPNVAGLDGLSF